MRLRHLELGIRLFYPEGDMSETPKRRFLRRNLFGWIMLLVCACATPPIVIFLNHRSKVPEIQKTLLDANKFVHEEAIPKAKEFAHRHEITFDSNFSWSKARHCKFIGFPSGRGLARLNTRDLSFTIFRMDDGIGEIMWFRDEKEWANLPTMENRLDSLIKLEAKTNLLNLQSALALAKRHFLLEGFNPNCFSEPTVEQFDCWSNTTNNSPGKSERRRVNPPRVLDPVNAWQSDTNHQINRRILLPYYHISWVVKDENPNASLVNGVEMDVSGISSNIVCYSAMFNPADLENHLAVC